MEKVKEWRKYRNGKSKGMVKVKEWRKHRKEWRH